jgi:hypothetical protein
VIYFASTGHTRVVGTPNFIEDVDTYASRLIDSTSVAVLPVDPTELFYDKPVPSHDTVNPRTSFDVIGLGAWYSHARGSRTHLHACRCNRPAATSRSRQRPAASNHHSQIVTLFIGALSLGTYLMRAPCCLLV